MGSKISGWCWLVFAAITLSVLVSFPAGAQVVGANLSGTVKDASGSVLPNAKVAIRNVDTGLTREVTTDTAGFYLAPNLLPGKYEATTTADGFETKVETGITLTVGAQPVLNIIMQVGQVTSKVEVTADAPTVELASSSVGALVNSTTVRELPLNGRSWTDLATLQPGVSGVLQAQNTYITGAQRAVRGFGNEITVSGGRPQWNNYRLDGISIDDYANGGPGSVLGGNLGVDAVQEFSMLTSSYSAEYGRTAAGVVNAITRSGTNQFHGAVYEFLRNSAMDARNFFDPATIPPFRRNQFGADGGAPIIKDRLFIFADYEGIRQSKNASSLETVPSVAARSGQLCSAPATPGACTAKTVTVDPAVAQFLPLWPLPTGALASSNGDIGTWNQVVLQVVGENFFTTRVDYKISDKDTLDGTYLRDFTSFTTPSPLADTMYGTVTNRQLVTLSETHVFSPAWVNSARFGYSREYAILNEALAGINPLASNPALAAIPGNNAPVINVQGLTSFMGGVGSPAANLVAWNSFQGYDDAFWTHRAHSIKFGGGVERIQDNAVTLSTGGIFGFSSLSNFLTNIPKNFTNRTNTTLEQGFRQTLYALYVQDDWRLRPNLTLNLGLRWETISVPGEVKGQLATLLNLTDATPHLGAPLYSNPTRRNFEPRLGFSWDPFKNGKTAVRGGFGILDVIPLPIEIINVENKAAPFARGVAVNFSAAIPNFFPAGAFSHVGNSSAVEAYYEQNHHRSYVMQYNLDVQRELPGHVTADVGYVGSRGVHLPFRSDDVDMVIPTLTSAGYLYPYPAATKINPNFGQVLGMLYNNNSDYNALQMRIQKPMSHGLQVQGSFTWQKGLDSGSATGSGDQFTNSLVSLPWYDMKAIRGLSDFNITRNLVISATWIIPTMKSLSGPASWVANGWELGAVYKANDGLPFSPTFGTNGDPAGIGNSSPIDFPSLTGASGCQSLINPGNVTNYVKTQCFEIPQAPSQAFYTANCNPNFAYPQCFNLRGNAGRNILIGPGLSNLDFSLYKNNYVKRISESFNAQFRVEVFNIFNRANFNFPASSDIFLANGIGNPAAGLIQSTATDSRQLQVALKVMW